MSRVLRDLTGAAAGLRGTVGDGPRSQQRDRRRAPVLQPGRHQVVHEGQQGAVRAEWVRQREDAQQD